MDSYVIEGARAVLPGGTEAVALRVEDGRIAALDGPRDGAPVVDARGLVLAPALVDVHGDAFERQLMPRPGVFFPLDVAVMETDRQLAGNGIATAYHALTLGWEPGLRSVARGTELVRLWQAMAARLTVENRVQLRWETFCFEAEPLIAEALAGPLTPSVAFNDHTTMAMLAPDVRLQDRPFDHAPDFPVVDTSSAAFLRKMSARAARSDIPAEDYVALLRETWERRPDVPDAIARVGAAAGRAGAAMFSHDDTQPETRAFYRGHGARVSEFPMNDRVAQAARDAGDLIVFGAPNVLRGGSHLGSPGAADMIARGLCDVLASDYYYPAMLAAVARLVADGVGPLHEMWKLVSANAAAASNLTDRGALAVGQRADLVLLDWPEGAYPRVRATVSGGRVAYDTGLMREAVMA
ncbi:alpha-D-ribose 1-methylphosphonate 5-triphosphate diphosphatase [Psychromarinibacter halotolerans]|uniref:Alpha-D-ribose 1-methylphosphonate 5-triphosphate diphosphatase n=1 Tax=Psychromarinibacter halotolerans TaxID=1775175 RepID=A0ABV7GUC5_9RHOB|nr:alpha-D-ribose 1-methylphosphonate 5-triphosphate diphosphatase [Psychromarinibacter halotolerans]MDF0598120.1 alpha-D-ribose 1-methylphosphonate 5-triphosphate diphosphatase [Psychromarinibacter halotolerans]